MKYTINGKAYRLLRSFEIFVDGEEKKYHEVRFTGTDTIQIISNEELESGCFEDISLIKTADIATDSDPAYEDVETSEIEHTEVDNGSSADEINAINLSKAPVEIDVGSLKLEGETEIIDVYEAVDSSDHTVETIIAISPSGKEFIVEDIKSFCNKNKLNLDVVNDVLSGKQKTHRRWKFEKRLA